MKQKLLTLLFVAFVLSVNAQELDFRGNINTNGLLFSEENSPFWMHTNQRGRIDELTNFSGLINAFALYNLSENSNLELGLGALYQDGYADKLQLDEAYLAFNNSWLGVVAGRKQRKEMYRGLSATNQSILWSLNARPLPGIRLFTKRPVFFKNNSGFGFEASLEEYFMDDDRYVENTRIHHKSFHLVYRSSPGFQISAGLRHFVQWGGTHPELGDLPSDFEAYTRVVTARGVGEDTGDGISEQEINGLGNHLGSYEINIKTILAGYNLEIIYNHLFEDGSGSVLRNTPDGRYGIFIEDPAAPVDSWFQAVMYEFYYTKNQSKNFPTSDGEDNYFNNNLYRSGWTYENRVLGLPFITLGPDRFRINNNKIVAHHIGLSGMAFKKVPYRFLGSFRQNYGAKGGGNITEHHVLSTYLDLSLLQNIVNLNLQLGTDFSEIDGPNFGAGISISKSFL
ncbi:capsule assembly Wzi family protein [Salegentibacter sp. JZCK2]|uniref:capsule assembly Wzi family protein n=1 Tax=Salegentibacter tibetensis TaxID=2873600 RepID=UPI001CCC8CF2|nr:capsule assembly Wzi family protein [Salegentibacter tibetensis]MBZ9731002.1 capsule assembly Wzi family protein [Salegentibacter tibetensis]